MYYGVSGFGNDSVLSGRPFGGCAILWRSDLHVNIHPIDIDSRRICVVSVSSENWKLVIVNVYMPREGNDANAGEFMYQLSLIEDVMASYGDSHFIILDVGVIPADQHTNCSVDYTYQFCMDRFSVLDHFCCLVHVLIQLWWITM